MNNNDLSLPKQPKKSRLSVQNLRSNVANANICHQIGEPNLAAYFSNIASHTMAEAGYPTINTNKYR